MIVKTRIESRKGTGDSAHLYPSVRIRDSISSDLVQEIGNALFTQTDAFFEVYVCGEPTRRLSKLPSLRLLSVGDALTGEYISIHSTVIESY